MFTISYSCAVVIPILSGFLWDLTRVPMLVFLPIGLCPLALIVLASGLRLGKP
jgi:CP family cyanate transporter-like MFS transporter